MKKLSALFFILMFSLSFVACGDSDSGTPKTTAATSYSISGKVTVGGVGLSHIGIQLNSSDIKNSAITDANGNYEFSNLENGDYTITPLTSGYTFDSASLSATVNNASVTGKDFIATRNSGASAYLHYTLPDQFHFLDNYSGKTVNDEAAILFGNYTITENILYVAATDTTPAEYVTGYALDQFVDKDTVNSVTPDPDGKLGTSDARKLYSFMVVSNEDGFSNRSFLNAKKFLFNSDLRWDQFCQGYLLDLNYSAKVFFPASLKLGNPYFTKNAFDIYMFRRIDVKRPDTAGTIASFEVGATTASYYDHTAYTAQTTLDMTKFTVESITFTSGSTTYTDVKAIPLTQFLTAYVVADATNASFTFRIVAVDDYTREGWTYADMQQAYYLVDYDFICQVSGGTQVSKTKINFPVRIEIVTTDAATITAADAYKYSSYAPPAFAKFE